MHFIRMLRQRHLAILWVSQVLSAISDDLYTIAVLWTAVRVAGGRAGIVAAAGTVATLLFGMLGSTIAAIGGPMGDIVMPTMIQHDLPANQIGKVYSLRLTIASGLLRFGLTEPAGASPLLSGGHPPPLGGEG